MSDVIMLKQIADYPVISRIIWRLASISCYRVILRENTRDFPLCFLAMIFYFILKINWLSAHLKYPTRYFRVWHEFHSKYKRNVRVTKTAPIITICNTVYDSKRCQYAPRRVYAPGISVECRWQIIKPPSAGDAGRAFVRKLFYLHRTYFQRRACRFFWGNWFGLAGFISVHIFTAKKNE